MSPELLIHQGHRSPFAVAADILDPPALDFEWFAPNPNDDIPGRARAKQRPPDGDWFVWLLRAGRGFGKSRAGAEWLHREVMRRGKAGQEVLVAGRTPADVRDYALHGEGGLLTHHGDEIDYLPSKRQLIWPNGVVGLIRSGANPEEFRGFSGELAWLEELASWKYPDEAYSNLTLGMRERTPQLAITTTPRPIKLLKEIKDAPGTVDVVGSSYENQANLSGIWVKNVLEPLEGTRRGRQEIHAELLEDIEGALWTQQLIDDLRVREVLVDLVRVRIGVDPQGKKMPGSETGIMGVGLGVDGHVYVIADASVNGTPAEWGNAAVGALDKHEGDKIIGEVNFGGDMVEHTIRTVRKDAPFEMVHASRGKQQRAEPVSALYEQGKVHHVGNFPELETEMTTFVPGESASPNRMDALVWAVWSFGLFQQEEPKKQFGTWGKRGRFRK